MYPPLAPNEEMILASLKNDDEQFISLTGVDRNSAQVTLIEHEDYLCMVFRGPDEIEDWLDNLNVFEKEVLFGEFHKGFWDSVEDVWDVVFPNIKNSDPRNQDLFSLLAIV